MTMIVGVLKRGDRVDPIDTRVEICSQCKQKIWVWVNADDPEYICRQCFHRSDMFLRLRVQDGSK